MDTPRSVAAIEAQRQSRISRHRSGHSLSTTAGADPYGRWLRTLQALSAKRPARQRLDAFRHDRSGDCSRMTWRGVRLNAAEAAVLGGSFKSAVASALYRTTLRELDLQDCGMDAQGARALAFGLASLTELERLSVRGNPLTASGVAALVGGLLRGYGNQPEEGAPADAPPSRGGWARREAAALLAGVVQRGGLDALERVDDARSAAITTARGRRASASSAGAPRPGSAASRGGLSDDAFDAVDVDDAYSVVTDGVLATPRSSGGAGAGGGGSGASWLRLRAAVTAAPALRRSRLVYVNLTGTLLAFDDAGAAAAHAAARTDSADGMNAAGLDALAELLRHPQCAVARLNLSKNTLHLGLGGPLLDALAVNRSLRSLSVASSGCGPEMALALVGKALGFDAAQTWAAANDRAHNQWAPPPAPAPEGGAGDVTPPADGAGGAAATPAGSPAASATSRAVLRTTTGLLKLNLSGCRVGGAAEDAFARSVTAVLLAAGASVAATAAAVARCDVRALRPEDSPPTAYVAVPLAAKRPRSGPPTRGAPTTSRPGSGAPTTSRPGSGVDRGYARAPGSGAVADGGYDDAGDGATPRSAGPPDVGSPRTPRADGGVVGKIAVLSARAGYAGTGDGGGDGDDDIVLRADGAVWVRAVPPGGLAAADPPFSPRDCGGADAPTSPRLVVSTTRSAATAPRGRRPSSAASVGSRPRRPSIAGGALASPPAAPPAPPVVCDLSGPDAPVLRVLKLRSNGLSAALRQLLRGIRGAPGLLRLLDLSFNPLGAAGAAQLADALADRRCALQELVVAGCGLTHDGGDLGGVRALAFALRDNTTLASLDISGSALVPRALAYAPVRHVHGVVADVAAALAVNTTLRRLVATGCWVDVTSARLLRTALATTPHAVPLAQDVTALLTTWLAQRLATHRRAPLGGTGSAATAAGAAPTVRPRSQPPHVASAAGEAQFARPVTAQLVAVAAASHAGVGVLASVSALLAATEPTWRTAADALDDERARLAAFAARRRGYDVEQLRDACTGAMLDEAAAGEGGGGGGASGAAFGADGYGAHSRSAAGSTHEPPRTSTRGDVTRSRSRSSSRRAPAAPASAVATAAPIRSESRGAATAPRSSSRSRGAGAPQSAAVVGRDVVCAPPSLGASGVRSPSRGPAHAHARTPSRGHTVSRSRSRSRSLSRGSTAAGGDVAPAPAAPAPPQCLTAVDLLTVVVPGAPDDAAAASRPGGRGGAARLVTLPRLAVDLLPTYKGAAPGDTGLHALAVVEARAPVLDGVAPLHPELDGRFPDLFLEDPVVANSYHDRTSGGDDSSSSGDGGAGDGVAYGAVTARVGRATTGGAVAGSATGGTPPSAPPPLRGTSAQSRAATPARTAPASAARPPPRTPPLSIGTARLGGGSGGGGLHQPLNGGGSRPVSRTNGDGERAAADDHFPRRPRPATAGSDVPSTAPPSRGSDAGGTGTRGLAPPPSPHAPPSAIGTAMAELYRAAHDAGYAPSAAAEETDVAGILQGGLRRALAAGAGEDGTDGWGKRYLQTVIRGIASAGRATTPQPVGAGVHGHSSPTAGGEPPAPAGALAGGDDGGGISGHSPAEFRDRAGLYTRLDVRRTAEKLSVGPAAVRVRGQATTRGAREVLAYPVHSAVQLRGRVLQRVLAFLGEPREVIL